MRWSLSSRGGRRSPALSSPRGSTGKRRLAGGGTGSAGRRGGPGRVPEVARSVRVAPTMRGASLFPSDAASTIEGEVDGDAPHPCPWLLEGADSVPVPAGTEHGFLSEILSRVGGPRDGSRQGHHRPVLPAKEVLERGGFQLLHGRLARHERLFKHRHASHTPTDPGTFTHRLENRRLPGTKPPAAALAAGVALGKPGTSRSRCWICSVPSKMSMLPKCAWPVHSSP